MADTLAELANRYYNEGYQLRFGGARDIYVREDQALPYIKALEAENAAQQQRIAELEKGLRFFSGAYARWQKELAAGDASNDFLTWAVNNGNFLDNADGACACAYDLLRAEKGGEG